MADRRSDIWWFGIVYELLTGGRLSDGETTIEILGAFIHKEPDWTPVPEPMRRLLQRCLRKIASSGWERSAMRDG